MGLCGHSELKHILNVLMMPRDPTALSRVFGLVAKCRGDSVSLLSAVDFPKFLSVLILDCHHCGCQSRLFLSLLPAQDLVAKCALVH